MGPIIDILDLILGATKSQQRSAANFLGSAIAGLIPQDDIEDDLADFFEMIAKALRDEISDN